MNQFVRIKAKIRFVLIVLSLTFFCESFLYPKVNQITPEEYNADKIFGFVKYMVSRNEFYRAEVELNRLDSYYPGYLNKDNIFVSELYFLFRLSDYPGIFAKENFTNNTNTNAIQAIFNTDASLQENEFIKANSIIKSAWISGINKDLDFYIYKRMILSYILINNIAETNRLIEDQNINLNYSYFDNNVFRDLISYGSKCYNSMKNPYKALTIGIIPGMGYIYAEERPTGIIAFILISALSAATYYSFKTNNKPVGIFIGAAATFFYGGSIIGGYLAAKRYNDTVMKDMSESLSQKLELSRDRENIFNKYGVPGVGK